MSKDELDKLLCEFDILGFHAELNSGKACKGEIYYEESGCCRLEFVWEGEPEKETRNFPDSGSLYFFLFQDSEVKKITLTKLRASFALNQIFKSLFKDHE